MKTLLTYTLSFIVLTVSFSCKDFLEINPQGDLTQATFPVSESDAILATNAAYATTREWYYYSGGYPILDIMSDDSEKGSNPNDGLSTVGPYNDFSFSTSQLPLDNWYTALFEGVKRANVVLEKVPAIDMEEALKNRCLAEASFLRALYYFDLVRAWGGVAIALTTETPIGLERNTAAEVYKLIEEDLLFAIEHLEEKSSQSPDDVGRATVGAAKSLLAKVFLFEKNFDRAGSYALEVINSGEYDLEPDFENANGEAGENGVESVFEVGALASTSGSGNQFPNTQGVRGTPNRGWGFNRPSMDLRAAFELGDPRQEATIIELGEVLDGIEIKGDGQTPDVDENGTVESYNQKVWTAGENTISQFSHNMRIIRYADVLLMAAEALNETDNPAQALIYLKEVRDRVNLPEVTTTDKEELRNLIYHERRVELALEGHRFWDLVRTGLAPTVLAPLGFQEGKHELLPIPQTQIDLSQGALKQNPNW